MLARGQATVVDLNDYNRNLLDTSTWVVDSVGSQVGFTQKTSGSVNENSIVMGLNPYGNMAPLWKCESSVPSTANNDGGWETSDIPIDHRKTYRMSVWVKRMSTNNGYSYFGLDAQDDAGVGRLLKLEVDRADSTAYTAGTRILAAGGVWEVTTAGTTGTVAPTSTTVGDTFTDGTAVLTLKAYPYSIETGQYVYFMGGTQLPGPAGKWYLIIGYVHGSGTTIAATTGGVYDPTTGRKVATATIDYKFTTLATTLMSRVYQWSCSVDGIVQYLYDPRIELCDGNEMQIDAILGGAASDYRLLEIADDGKVTPQEKPAIVSRWCEIINDPDMAGIVPTGNTSTVADGEFKTLRDKCVALSIWTPGTAGTESYTYYTAVNALRAYLFNTPAVIRLLVYANTITIDKATWLGLWTTVRASANALTNKLASFRLDDMANDSKITIQEKQHILPRWCEIINDQAMVSAVPKGSTDSVENGSFKTLRDSAVAASIWTPESTGASAAKTYYTAVEALRGYLFTTPGVILAGTWTTTIAVDKTTWVGLWSAVQSSADGLRNAVVNVSPINAPKYLGPLTADPSSGMNTGDFYFRTNVTPKKIRRYSGTAWGDVASDDARYGGYIGAAIRDMAAVALAEGDDGFTFFSTLVSNNLFARSIQVLTGGSFRAGARFASDGTLSDEDEKGIWIGADGTAKLGKIVLSESMLPDDAMETNNIGALATPFDNIYGVLKGGLTVLTDEEMNVLTPGYFSYSIPPITGDYLTAPFQSAFILVTREAQGNARAMILCGDGTYINLIGAGLISATYNSTYNRWKVLKSTDTDNIRAVVLITKNPI